jgi:hypothetical protein
MRMVGQGAAPAGQHTEAPDQPTDIMRVRGARDEGSGGGAAPDVVPVALLAADELPQLVGPGQDDVNLGAREQCPAPLCQPGFGVLVMAVGAPAVAAGVVDLGCLTTGLALPQRSAPGRGATVDASLHGPARAGPQIRRKPVQGLAAVPPPDGRHLPPARAPAR